MIRSTQIARLDSLILAAAVDDEQSTKNLSDPRSEYNKASKQITEKSEPQASIVCGDYTIHYLVESHLKFICTCDPSYPRKLAFTYLKEIASEFTTTYPSSQYMNAQRPYAFIEFDTYIQRTKKLYQDVRATPNMDKLSEELNDVSRLMTKSIEDLLYRGDSLERMGEMSGRLRDDARKYRRSAVRINWELLLKQYGPFGAIGLILILFLVFRFW